MNALKYLIILFPFSLIAQNLVPNGNFESGTYNGGSNPPNYYSGVNTDNWWDDLWNQSSPDRFNDDVDDWYVAKADKAIGGRRRDSPDWMDPNQYYDSQMGGNCTQTKYVRCATPIENIMVKMADGHKLIKGETYKFRIKARAGVGTEYPSHNFQLIFTKDDAGLNTNNNNKWIAGDFYISNGCEWTYFEHVFTVPTDSDHKYDQMDYLVLHVNYYRDGSNDPNDYNTIYDFDDVVLLQEPKCIDHKYIQDRVYANEHRIEQANVQISAGAYVSPYPWEANFPVVVKNTAMVIYRAPTVYLEPGFFVEEEGSYFETQVGTCVENPCPPIPQFTYPDVVNCSVPFTLGQNFPETPGIFYVWQPESYFSNPWSRITEFTPSSESGCLNANLIVWTICGESQQIPFTLKWFDGPPTVNISNIQQSASGINFDVDLTNANTYTVSLFDPVTGTVYYDDFSDVTCNQVGQTINVNFNHCTTDLCRDLVVNVVAHNDCYGTASDYFTWQAPTVNAPTISVSNLVSNDFDYQFDLNIPQEYEYFTIETWNESMTQLVCSESYSKCSNPYNGSSYHYNVRNCLANCLAQCKNYKVRITMKSYCNETIQTQTLNWNKTNTNFAMPTSYPNVITLDNDGINETLCFSPTGADFYHLVVVDRWGITVHESTGCVDEIPLCIWTPAANTEDGTFYYTITFSNQCGQTDQHTDFVQVWNSLNGMVVADNVPRPDANVGIEENISLETGTSESTNSERVEESNANSGLVLYPNPTTDKVTIFSSKESITDIILLDANGKILSQIALDAREHSLSLSGYESGIYYAKIKTNGGTWIKKIVRR